MSSAPSRSPSAATIFLAFTAISARAFGGVLPWTRHELVERRRWLTGEEFTELLGLAQFLPGPNISNLCVAVGARFAGRRGAIAAFLGLYSLPCAIVLLLAQLYGRFGTLPMISGALRGLAAVAAGLIAAMALKMAAPLFRRPPGRHRFHPVVFIVGTLTTIGLWKLPMLMVIPILAPLAILSWRTP